VNYRWLLAVFLAGGALVRVWGLSDHGLWIDEYGTWWTVAGESWGDCWNRALAIHGQSPFYYFVVRASTELLGPGLFSLRLPSLVSGIGLLALGYPLALRVFRDPRIALLAVAAFAVNEHLIYYSQEARPYGLALLCAGASFTFYAALLERGGRGIRVAYVATTLLAYYVHYLFGIIVVAQVLHFALQRPWTAARWRPWLGTLALLALLTAPGLWQLRSLFGRRQTLDWITTPSGPFAALQFSIDLLDPVALAVVGAGVLVAWIRQREVEPIPAVAHPGIALLWFGVPILAFATLAPMAGISLLHPRYIMIALPAVPLLYAALLALPRGGPWLRTLPLALFLCVVVGLRILPMVQRNGGPFWWFFQHDWEATVDELVHDYRDGDLILYRTGFVELDELVRGRASATTTEFVEWPLLAHLPADREFRRIPLPYRETPELRALVASRLRAANPQRVWVVGLGPADSTTESFRALLRMAPHGRPMRVTQGNARGVVGLYLLEPRKRASGKGPAAAESRSLFDRR
jgi:mannosyltransferase